MSLFFGYFDPVKIFFENKINDFRGDLSDISAKTATLTTTDYESKNKKIPYFTRYDR